jgi:hypothetical protein
MKWVVHIYPLVFIGTLSLQITFFFKKTVIQAFKCFSAYLPQQQELRRCGRQIDFLQPDEAKEPPEWLPPFTIAQSIVVLHSVFVAFSLVAVERFVSVQVAVHRCCWRSLKDRQSVQAMYRTESMKVLLVEFDEIGNVNHAHSDVGDGTRDASRTDRCKCAHE